LLLNLHFFVIIHWGNTFFLVVLFFWLGFWFIICWGSFFFLVVLFFWLWLCLEVFH